VKSGDIYKIGDINYMIIEIVNREWPMAPDGAIKFQIAHVSHVTCMGPSGSNEFPMDWFIRHAEPLDEAR
jgi:hypothetical protein